MEVLAGSDMARMLNVLVPDAKRYAPRLWDLFYQGSSDIMTQIHQYDNIHDLNLHLSIAICRFV